MDQAVDKRVKTLASVVASSDNVKLGPMAATYAAQVTCPLTCPLRGAGCYAESGAIAFGTNQRNDVATLKNAAILEVLQDEADGIDRLFPRSKRGKVNRFAKVLRVHVVGDSPTDEAAAVTGAAMVRYQNRTEKRAWTYTHAWRTVKRSSWQGANVLASCETPAEAREAMAAGYGAAIVVPTHKDVKAYRLDGAEDLKVIPCPNQTRGVKCKDCQLCSRPDMLREQNAVIAFEVHGAMKGTAAAAIVRKNVQS